VTATPPALAADLTAGLKRLKMAGMRQLAPELLVTAKSQRWNPEEFPPRPDRGRDHLPRRLQRGQSQRRDRHQDQLNTRRRVGTFYLATSGDQKLAVD